jgi:CHAD domain-containing protein
MSLSGVELQWLGSVLGAVRDLDVLLARLRDEAAALDPSDRAAAGRLLRALERQRTRARRTLLKALDSQRYDALLDRFEQLVTTLEPTASKATLGKLAERELDRLRRDVRALGEEPDDTALHGLRKRGKRVRYAYELAGAKAVVKRAKAFQDVLGEHQDSVVAEERLRAISQDAPADQALAAGLLIERERARRTGARASWRKVWRELERAAR